MADHVLTGAKVLDRGTRPAEIGKAIGEMAGGLFLTISSVTGDIVCTGLTVSGIGSWLGVPT
jgi:hypothetical protein